MVSSGFKNNSNTQYYICFRLSGTPTISSSASGSPAGGRSASGNSASDNAARAEDPEKSSLIGTQVGVSTYPDDPLNVRTDMDESADEHNTRYGVGTGIRGDSSEFGASGARLGLRLCCWVLTKVPNSLCSNQSIWATQWSTVA